LLAGWESRGTGRERRRGMFRSFSPLPFFFSYPTLTLFFLRLTSRFKTIAAPKGERLSPLVPRQIARCCRQPGATNKKRKERKREKKETKEIPKKGKKKKEKQKNS